MTATCIRCKECFNECLCEDEYTAVERRKLTPLGATLRARARQEARASLKLLCSCCIQMVPDGEIGEHTIPNMLRGHTKGPRHVLCRNKPSFNACSMTCEKCDTVVTSRNYDGQVNSHKTKQGWICTTCFILWTEQPNQIAQLHRKNRN